MAKLIMMRGLPGSGKSTKTEELLREYGNYVRVNRDLLRTMLHFDKWSGPKEGLTKAAQRTIVAGMLKADVGVIVDDTNLTRGHHDSWRDLAKECGAQFEVCEVDTDWQVCVNRDAAREKHVGRHVIIGMARQYRVGGYDMEQPEIICDIDGTLADLTHRRHFVDQDPKDWKGFFAETSNDTPIQKTIDMVKQYHITHRVILVSGRPEYTRKATEEWLAKYEVPYHVLFMRKENDKRPDDLVKKDILHDYFDKSKIELVIDDRPRVIRMWRENGLTVEDVGDGVEF